MTTADPPFVEPVDTSKAWTRGDRPWRPWVSLRQIDHLRVLHLMRGTGMTLPAFTRLLLQEAIQARMTRQEEADL